jgi:methylmalonyl-CoA mutase
MEEQDEKLFTEFPPVSASNWEAQIRTDLKGADYEKKLIRKSLDNIRIKPYYTAEDLKELEYLDQLPGEFPYVRGGKTAGNSWEIRQDFIVSDIATTLQKAKMVVERGVASVGFDLTAKGDLYYHDFRKLITGFDFNNTSINLLSGEYSPNTLDYLLKALAELNVQSSAVRGSLDYDPLGYLTRSGGFYRSEQDDFSDADKLLLSAENELPDFRVLAVNSHHFGDSGASAVQELAFGLAMIAEYMVKLTDLKHNVAAIAKHLQWNLGTGSDYFMEIAKIRAARLLFSGLFSAFDAVQQQNAKIFIHSITTNWNKTIYDPNVNMLRLTTEAMAAILGGCNSLLVKPYDSFYKEQGDFSERMARNIQNILKEESYFNRVADPAAGSYYIESMTHSLVESAWDLFLKVDEHGGYIKAFIAGFIGQEISKTNSNRMEMVASRREVLLGTNQFPNLNEKMIGEVDAHIAFPDIMVNQNRIATPIAPMRAAEGFEKLRLQTEKSNVSRPRVFMLTYGNLAMRLARSQFSGNFFACAGYEIIDNPGFQSAKEGVEAAFAAKADIIVVCSSDEEYPGIAPAVADLVKDKAIVVVAGAPACMDELKQQGIAGFIHVRSNVLETLKSFHAKLGIV